MFGIVVDYGLKVNDYVDERWDFYKLMEVVIYYFKKVYEKYGDWVLVLVVYNGGFGWVSWVIKRGCSKNFWKICCYMFREICNYVFVFIVVMYFMEYYKQYDIEFVYLDLEL